MGRKRRAWLENKTGIVMDGQKRRPGYHVRWHEYQVGRAIHRRRKFETLQSARRFVTRYNAKSDLGLIDEIVPVTLLEAQREFLLSREGTAAGTQRQYAAALLDLAGFLGNVDLFELAPAALHEYFTDRRQTLSAGTLNKKARHLHAFFNWAMTQNYRRDNPLLAVPAIKRSSPARKRPPISDELLDRLLAHTANTSERIAILIACTTGMDREDIQRLTPEWVDLENGCLRGIRQKSKKPGVDELHPDLVEQLRPLVRRTKRGSRLLPGLYYRPWIAAEKRSADWWNRLCERAGVEGVLFRDLRAYAGRWMMRAPGVTLIDVKNRLRHASIETTAKHYDMPDAKVHEAIRTLPLPGSRAIETGRAKGKTKSPASPRAKGTSYPRSSRATSA